MNKLKPALEFGYDPPNSCLKVGFYRQLSKIYTSKLGSPTQPGCKQRSYKKIILTLDLLDTKEHILV